MDRNSVIGFSLIMLIFVGWYIWMAPNEEQLAHQKHLRDSIDQVRQQQAAQQLAQPAQPDSVRATVSDTATVQAGQSDSLRMAADQQRLGVFAQSASGKAQVLTLENQVLKVQFSTQGAKPISVVLKDYQRHDSTPLVLFDAQDLEFGLQFFAANRAITTDQLYFEPQGSSTELDASSAAQLLRMRLVVGPGQYIEYSYSMLPNSYLIDFNVQFVGLEQVIDARKTAIDLHWKLTANALERGDKWEKDNTGLYYKFSGNEVDYLSLAKDDAQETLNTQLKWVAFKQQFFSSILISKNHFEEGVVAYKRSHEKDMKHVMDYSADLSLATDPQNANQLDFQLFFGPNKFSLLSTIDDPKGEDLLLEELIPYFGFGIGYINRFVIIPLFDFLTRLDLSMGLIILLMTIIIKLVLFPFTYKSYVSMAEMRVLKPEIDKINEKIPADKAMERQQATMALYRKAGVNPMGGCLPVLLQFPILIAMFRFFPASIELRQEAFLWATDLSTYDVLFMLPFGLEIPFYGTHVSGFTLLMTLSTILTMKFSNTQMPSSNQMPGMQTMMYLMPVMFMFMFNSYSAGLSYYYFLSNIITFGQTMAIRQFTSEEKILARLEQNKKKPQTKSRFQQRLEEMARQQQNKKK